MLIMNITLLLSELQDRMILAHIHLVKNSNMSTIRHQISIMMLIYYYKHGEAVMLSMPNMQIYFSNWKHIQ